GMVDPSPGRIIPLLACPVSVGRPQLVGDAASRTRRARRFQLTRLSGLRAVLVRCVPEHWPKRLCSPSRSIGLVDDVEAPARLPEVKPLPPGWNCRNELDLPLALERLFCQRQHLVVGV